MLASYVSVRRSLDLGRRRDGDLFCAPTAESSDDESEELGKSTNRRSGLCSCTSMKMGDCSMIPRFGGSSSGTVEAREPNSFASDSTSSSTLGGGSGRRDLPTTTNGNLLGAVGSTYEEECAGDCGL